MPCFSFFTIIYNQYLLSGVLGKDDHRQLKAQYAKEAKAISESLMATKNELHALVSGGDSAFTLTENFQKFASLTELDRRTVASLIHNIRVEAKDKLHITFHYQPGFEEIQELHDHSDREKGVA